MAAAERRIKLLEAARTVIARDGVAAATTRAVAAEAGMPLASFHYVFESQLELMREMILTFADEEVAAMAAIELPEGFDGGAAAILDHYIDYVTADRSRQVASYEIVHYALRTPGLEGLAATRIDTAKQMIAGIVRRLEEAYGPLQVDLDLLTHLMLVLGDGIAIVYVGGGDEQAARAVARVLAPKIEEIAFGRTL